MKELHEFKYPEQIDKKIVGRVTHSGTLQGQYFYGARDKIIDKEIAYRELIETQRQPFIICVDCSETKISSVSFR